MRTLKDKESDEDEHDHEHEKDEKRLKELREKHSLTHAEQKELDELEEKEAKHAHAAPVPATTGPVPPKDLSPAQQKFLLAEARQIFVDHVTKLGGVGGPLGPIGDRMVAFLTTYDAWTHPTQLPADDKDLEGLPKEEKDRIAKERKALREKAAKEAEHPTASALNPKEPKEHEEPKKVFGAHAHRDD